MAKGSGKSSASSGTRKKHARRANAGPDDPVTSVSKPKDKKQKGKGKQAIEPRKKAYIPPTKPAPVRADPLDSLGLVRQLPAELVVILRKLGKKDEVTKTKALEEFQNEWVEGVKGIEAESMEEGLGLMLPVWLHHVPILFSHSSRRIRLLAVTIHGKLFRIVHVRGQLFFNLREVLDADSVELILGSWCMAAHDIDRQVSITARRSLDEHVSLFQSETKLAVSHAALVSFVQRAIFDPLGYYLYLNPVQVPINTTPPKIVRGRVVAAPPSASRSVEPEVRHVDEENEDDRKARLRVGALGVLQWLLDSRAQTDDKSKTIADLMELLSHPSLWTSLQSWSKDSNAYGLGQPPVRSSAWKLLHTLVLNWKADILPLIPMLSAAVLYAAPREPDVQVRSVSLAPWLTFLKEFPNAWELEATYSDVDSEEEGESEAEEEARGDDQSPKAGDASKITPIKRWGAFREFLQFLELGCGGSPIQCYPIVLIILSTIPPSVLTQADTDRAVPYPAHAFFVSFWAALDGRALSSTLERSATSLAFLSSLLECTAFIARRLRSETQGPAMLANHEDQDGNGASRALVRDQYARAWEEMAQGRLKLDHAQGAKVVAGSLTALENYSPELFEGAWNAFVPSLMEHAINGSPLASVFARTFRETFSQETHAHIVAGKLVGDIASSIIMTARTLLMQDSDAGATGAAQLAGLASLIETFNDTLSKDAQLSQDLHSTMQSGLYKLAGIAPKLLVVYIARRVDQTLWQNLLAAISARPTLVHSTLPVLVEAAENDALPDPLRPVDQALDSALATLFQEAADHRNNEALRLVLRVVRHHEHFLSASSFETLLHLVVAQLGEQCCVLLSAGEKDIPLFEALLDIVAAAVCTPSGFVAPVDIAEALIPDVFLAAHLFGICYEGGEIAGVVRLAKRIWREWMGVADKLGAENITMIIHRKLRDTICDVTAKAAPRDVLRAATTAQLPLRVDITTILPEPAFLNQLAAKLNQHPAHPALAVILPLIPPTSSFDVAETVELQTDVAGLSAYARATSAWLQAAMDDRYMARSQIWILRHLINLGVLAEEFMIAPGLQSPLFSKEVEKGMLEGIMLKVQQLAAYLLSVPHHDKWHADVTSAVTNGKTSGLDPTATCVAELLSGAVDRNTYRESRIVFDVLLYVLSDASTMEADLWMGLAHKLEKAAEQISLAIVHALARSGAEPLRLDRYRNELAADALGVPTSQVNTKGLLLLRRLAASAPDPDSDVAFLPQQRAINLVKACNTWLASDEDIEEDVESELTGLFVHLVPILQNVPGSHWELMLDIVENNLENASFDDELTLTSLIRSIKLAETIQEFATYNKALREIWSTRKGPLLSLIMNIVASEKSATVYFEPRSICREAALLLLQNMPASLLDHETLSKTTHLLSDPSTTVLKMSYELLRDAAKKYTEHLVIEAGVDLESQVKIELPTELVSFLQEHTIDIADPASEKGSSIFALLLGWMVFLDLFEDTSAKVKTGYAEQLTFLDITATHLLPTISTLLDIRPNSKPFKLDVWAVDEFYIPEADPDDFLSMRLFAAHVYYRALITIPSLVRDWLTSYNDRGTQITIAGYTSTFFSPPIISSELTRIRTAEGSDLEADNFAVKLAPTVREISAVYTVDDQQLEFTLKIPSNWPLQRIEIRESKLVGVTESRWRGWLLGVQQIVWSQNGHVLDAIKHFKNNVVLHFQGQVECAICYSIISASEGALPKKPCRTCKNRFHSSCLYKWFESSHSSSCPLCRSDIM